jgi:hypothetical protein
MQPDQVKFEISFEDEAPQDVYTALQEVGADEVKEVTQRGLTGVEFVIVGVVIASAVCSIVGKVLRLWKCGVIVDARGVKVTTEKDCKLPRGTVLIVNRDGTEVTLHEPSDQQLTDLIGKLASGKS